VSDVCWDEDNPLSEAAGEGKALEMFGMEAGLFFAPHVTIQTDRHKRVHRPEMMG
jgi:hypothetical protein